MHTIHSATHILLYICHVNKSCKCALNKFHRKFKRRRFKTAGDYDAGFLRRRAVVTTNEINLHSFVNT